MSNRIRKDMHLLVVALFDDSYLEDVILGLTSISGAQVTIVDAISGTQNLSHAIPMFAEFVGMGGKRFCKILMTCVSEPNSVERLLEGLSEGGLEFDKLDIGAIYTIPLSEAVVIEDIDIF